MRVRPRFLVLTVALFAVVAAFAATGAQQRRATDAKEAELQLTALRLDISQVQDVPWGASPGEGDAASDVAGELGDTRDRILSRLARLSREDGLDPAEITAPLERGVDGLSRVLAAIIAGESPDEDASKAAHSLAIADRALQTSADRYRVEAAHAFIRARAQFGAVTLILFAAFAWYFGRVAKARRVAERLVLENQRLALTDALTGLGNRRALQADLAASDRLTVAMFDLNGFKHYNDTFGHPAGDALLARLGERLATTLEGIGTAYRMGGDEFCVLAAVEDDEAATIAALAAAALSESGEGFTIECAYGIACLPGDTTEPDAALLLADQRMYEHKSFARIERATYTQ